MQTTVLLDDKLFQEAALYARTDNPGELIQLALHELIRSLRSTVKSATKRRLGMDKGRFSVPDDFYIPNAEIEKAFYGT
jgi:Arc/MetJ family transcription regulator